MHENDAAAVDGVSDVLAYRREGEEELLLSIRRHHDVFAAGQQRRGWDFACRGERQQMGNAEGSEYGICLVAVLGEVAEWWSVNDTDEG